MGSLRRSDVQALVKALSAGYSPGNVRNIYDTLARVCSTAVDDRVLAVSPCRNIALPRSENAEVKPPTVEEVAALRDAMTGRYRGAILFLAGSGLRIGEMLGLRVADVDFLRRTVRVERQRLQDGRTGPTKTKGSTRTVPLGQVVLDELAAHLAAYPSSEWLFLDAGGHPLVYPEWKKEFNAAVKAAEIPHLTTHDLRHFFASALIAGGASVKQVQTVLGHASAMVTLRTYAHLWPGDEDRTRAVVDATLNVLRTPCGQGEEPEDVRAGQSL